VLLSIFPLAGASSNAANLAWLHTPERLVLVLARDLSRRPRPVPESLLRAFRLTPSEARLAGRLAAGDTLAQTAEALGLSKETLRSQLRAIFAKTGVHRQADLVALLSRLRH
jgi:DNA-binding CsgD family transcriptional regulator